jgi:hypothetical protein
MPRLAFNRKDFMPFKRFASVATLVAAMIFSLGLTSGCGGPAPRRPPPPEGVMQVSARLAPPPAEAVVVKIGNLPPGRRIEEVALLDPNGGRHLAPSLTTVRGTEGGLNSGPFVGVGVSGGSSSGINPSISLGWNVTGGDPERETLRIEATVPIPDPAAYRTDSAHWRVQVVFTELDGERRTLMFPARAP